VLSDNQDVLNIENHPRRLSKQLDFGRYEGQENGDG